MHLLNRELYGHLVNPETFDTNLGPYPELYQLFENRLDWDLRYVHQDYWKLFEPNSSLVEQVSSSRFLPFRPISDYIQLHFCPF